MIGLSYPSEMKAPFTPEARLASEFDLIAPGSVSSASPTVPAELSEIALRRISELRRHLDGLTRRG